MPVSLAICCATFGFAEVSAKIAFTCSFLIVSIRSFTCLAEGSARVRDFRDDCADNRQIIAPGEIVEGVVVRDEFALLLRHLIEEAL